MKITELLKKGEEILKESGVEEYRTDAWLLLEHDAGITRAHYLAYPDEEADSGVSGTYLSHIEKRAGGYPVQYITGSACFMGYEIKTDPRVLIPRFDTESVAQEAIELSPEGGRVLDMCTGSGCIAIALAGCGKGLRVTGCDISDDALKVCRMNAAANGFYKIEWIRGDLFEKVEGTFDLIVSNPPYITAEEMEELPPEVRCEPEGALYGGDDGLIFYRRIAEECRGHLEPGGFLVFETGAFQTDDVQRIMKDNGFGILKVIVDLSGRKRGVSGRLGGLNV